MDFFCPKRTVPIGHIEQKEGSKRMKEQIEKIKKTAIDEIAKAEDLQTLEDARVKYLGKKGKLTAVLRGMGGLSPEERPIIGGLVNEAKESLEKLIQEKEEKFIATVACKAAVKANMALTKEEVDKLMSQLLVLPNPFTCPHGRPTAIKMSKNDIEKKFSRR